MTEIFVFGSNTAGRHGKGAALYAKQNHDAQYGIGEGLTGNAYALPTKDDNLKMLPINSIAENYAKFKKTAEQAPEWRFLLTPFGTGLAGYDKAQIWKIIKTVGVPKNVVLTSSWVTD